MMTRFVSLKRKDELLMSLAVPASSSNTHRSSRTRRTEVPRRFDRRVRDLRQLRHRTERATLKMHEETRALAVKLVSQGLTLRSVGELLGITYQRVQQILKGE